MSWRLNYTSHKSHITATTEQVQALSLLKDESTTNIIAYTKHARSLTHRFDQGVSHGLLSNEQLDAIGTLSSCREDEVRILLERPHASQDSEACPGRHRSDLTPCVIPSATLQRPVSGQSHDNAVSQQHAAYGAHTQVLHQSLRPYSCTICQRSYQNHVDWKKHEKEHEYTYTCMASGHWDAEAQAFACTYCGVLNPGEEHFKVHGIKRCNTQNKRREKIVKHLKDCHMVGERAVGESLADNWRCDQGKRFWACGFCVMLFDSFKDRLHHIGKEHYDQGQKFENWDANKVIRGLLLQSMVRGAWESLVDAHCFRNASELTWEASDLKDLQYKLEIGPTDERSGAHLAEFAYRASKMPFGRDSYDDAISLPDEPQHQFQPEPSSTGNNFDNGVSFNQLPTTEQKVGAALAPAVSPFSDYLSSTPFYSGTSSQLRTPAEDLSITAANTLLLGEHDDYQGWAIDPVLFSQPDALKNDNAMEFDYDARHHRANIDSH